MCRATIRGMDMYCILEGARNVITMPKSMTIGFCGTRNASDDLAIAHVQIT